MAIETLHVCVWSMHAAETVAVLTMRHSATTAPQTMQLTISNILTVLQCSRLPQ